jgi:protein phosphatase
MGSGSRIGKIGNGPAKNGLQQNRLMIERNQLNLLLNREARISARLRVLDRILSGNIKFEQIKPPEIKSVLEQLIEHPELGEKAKQAISQLPPPLPAAEEPVKVERVEDSSPVIEVYQLSVMLSRGQSGVLDGEMINNPDLGGVCAASGRKKNEDGLLLRSEEGKVLIMVADGMGGHAGGEIASDIALKEMDKFAALEEDSKAISPKKAFGVVQNAILAEKLTKPQLKEMGTTAVAAFIEGNRARITNVGDTRAFLLRSGNLILLTRDDGSLPAMYEASIDGKFKLPLNQEQTKDYFDYSQEYKDSPKLDLLYKAMGREQDKKLRLEDPIQGLKTLGLELKEDDMLLFFSDGGYKFFKDFEEFRGIILANAEKTPHEIGQALEKAAKERMPEHGDNVTVAVYKHRPVSEVSDSMIFEESSLSDSAIKEALEEESTTVWERPTTQELEKETSTLINEVEGMMREATKSITRADIGKALDGSADLQEKHGALLKSYKAQQENLEAVQKKLEEILKKFEALKTSDAHLIAAKNNRIKAMGREIEDLRHAGQIAEGELEKAHPELVPLLGLISGTPEQKKAILESIQIGEIEVPAENEAGAVEIVSRAWRFDKGLEEDARAVIDFINIKVEEEGDK